MAGKNIFQRMADVTAELSAVAKNLDVGVGNNKYKAVGEADVLAAVKPLEKKHGIYSYPEHRNIAESYVMTTKNYKGEERQNQFLRIETTYTFVNVDEPTDRISIITYGDGVDSQDKAPGKAMTYGDKYALLKAYKIITGDDPDQDESQEGKFEEPKKEPVKKPTKKATATAEQEATKEQRDQLTQGCALAGVTTGYISEKVGIERGHLTVAQFNEAMNLINVILEEKEKR